MPRLLLLLLPFLLSACALKTVHLTEQNFLPNPKTLWVSDGIQRSNLQLPLPGGAGHLRGWKLKHPAPKGTLIYFMGNGQTVLAAGYETQQLAQLLEADVLVFDYRGSGGSDGSKSLALLREDALRIYDSLPREPGRPLWVMGYSMGSMPAIHLAANRAVDGLVVLAGISSFKDVSSSFGDKVPWYAKPFVRFSWDPVFETRPQPVEQIAGIKVPTLVVHGTADTTLPVLCGDSLAAASTAGWKQYQRVEGLGHNRMPLFEPGAVQSALLAWRDAASVAPGRAKPLSAPLGGGER